MARARSLAEFQKSFPDEESCAAFLFKQRWPDGFVCPGCGKRRVVGLKSRPRLHECLDCGWQTSVTAGTTMHRSKLPLTTWFCAAHLMTTHSNGMSARQLEDQLGVTYKTAWLLTQKLRRSMVDPNREPLEGVVEVDQAEIPFREGDAFFEPGNAGKILVIGAVEVIDRASNQAKPRRKHAKYLDTRSGRLRLDLMIRSCPSGRQGTLRMMSAALYAIVGGLGNVLGTNLYDYFGGFTVCVIAIAVLYALILPVLLLVPKRLIDTADGQTPEV